MIQTVTVRAGTTAEWADADASDDEAAPVLAAGEVGIDTTTGAVKVGDGATAFASLPGRKAAVVAAPLAAITGGESPTEAEFNLLRGTVADTLTALKAAGLMATS